MLSTVISDSFYNEENRSGFIVSSNRKKLWAIQLDLLREFDNICKKHGLKYFVDSGTLLGTIRHKGFIPWDDDIDVVMIRRDYDILCTIAEKEFNKPYFYQCVYTDREYYRGHSQLRRSDTTFILTDELYKSPFNQGVFIDIFPLDYVPVNDADARRMSEIIKHFHTFTRVMSKGSDNGKKKILKTIFRNLVSIIGDKNIYRYYEKKISKYSKDKRFVDKLLYYPSSEKWKRIPVKYFETTIHMEFENLLVPVPVGYDRILKLYYGENYMTPRNIPSSHATNQKLIINTDIPYTEVLKQINNRTYVPMDI